MVTLRRVSLFFACVFAVASPQPQSSINPTTVTAWTNKLEAELVYMAKFVSRVETIEADFKAKSTVQSRRGEDLLHEIVWNVQNMTESKISAVRRIMDTAENSAQGHQDDDVTDFEYYNAKNLTDEEDEGVILTENKHFYNKRVNTSFSAVHVPTNVYDRAPDLLKAVQWSEKLNSIFVNNYNMDPSLSWQYFGSSLGFLRQYPAAKWEQVSEDVDVDLYDCRTREWYIEAAASPKDMVILVDNSGSMTGMRREIARHVVNDILDTLGPNDFVNVYNFSDDCTNIVGCFDNGLVQATLENIRELKQGMEDLYTDKIANFSNALTMAFDLLLEYRTQKRGAACNQAIMLITDGVPYNYKEIFKLYNWEDLPFMPVRVFTYLIGREVADVREVKWMACANQGYFVHLSTLSEVKEKVLEYIPVMARPLVLSKTEHPITWTAVYADVADPKMTDWLWDSKESEDQKEIFLQSRKMANRHISPEEQIQKYLKKRMSDIDEDDDDGAYQLMTSVSMPVLDRRENANLTEWELINKAIWVQKIRETRIAYLLGVAGTDVPIKELKELLMPHKLGVNAYAFLVTNNGHIVLHPDFRPVFQGILKPSYNSVDMTEVEILDNDLEPREESEEMMKFRDAVIRQSSGSVTLNVKYHYDKMKRASNATRKYFYTALQNTPFTLVISLPLPYGQYRVHGEFDVSYNYRHKEFFGKAVMKVNEETQVRVPQHNFKHLQILCCMWRWALLDGKFELRINPLEFFNKDRNWKIHPDWVYCRYHFPSQSFETPEEEFLHFLKKTILPNWKWLNMRTVTPPEHMEPSHSQGKKDKLDETTYFCDRDLFLSLVFDGNVTANFSRNIYNNSTSLKEGGVEEKSFQERFGVTVSFVATRSGLTRWKDYLLPEERNRTGEQHFSEIHNRAIDEVWYKRAVNYHYIQPYSFVYSVPYEAGEKGLNILVTVSKAVFLTSKDDDLKAPAAVTGFQFKHTALHNMLYNVTSTCPSCNGKYSNQTCTSKDLECYVLDNNGYIIVSENTRETGKFFGELRASVMEEMVRRNMFSRIRIFDYQAVCFRPKSTGNCASYFITPFAHLKWMIEWTFGYIFWMIAQANLNFLWLGDIVYASDEGNYEDMTMVYDDERESQEMPANENNKGGNDKQYERWTINRTRPQPCDKEVFLYEMNPHIVKENKEPFSSDLCKRFFEVRLIQDSNLIFVVVDAVCTPDDNTKLSVQPQEVQYNASSLACYKVQNKLRRTRPKSCINRHKEESKIDLCGGSSSIHLSFIILLLSWVAVTIIDGNH